MSKWLSKKVYEAERSPFYAITDYARGLNLKDVIFLNVGEPDFTTPKHIIEAAKKALDEGFTHYSGDKGLLELRQLIAEKLRNERKFEVDPAEGVVITSGGGEANWAALMSLINPGDEVLIPSPYYPPYNTSVRLAGGVPVPVPLKEELGFEWDPMDVERRITDKTKLIIVCSPNNPTGGVLGKKCITELARIAQEHDLLVLSDEVYEAFLYDNEKFCSIASIPGMEGRTIITNSFSKTYAMTGWRVGFIAGNSEIISNALKVHYATTVCASTISQKAAIAALTGPQNCVKEMAAEYDMRRKITVDGLNKIAGFKCNMPKGAFYVFPNIKQFKMSSEAFAKYLVKEARVVVVNGSAFGPDGEGFCRVSYAASKRNIVNALERIAKATEQLK